MVFFAQGAEDPLFLSRRKPVGLDFPFSFFLLADEGCFLFSPAPAVSAESLFLFPCLGCLFVMDHGISFFSPTQKWLHFPSSVVRVPPSPRSPHHAPHYFSHQLEMRAFLLFSPSSPDLMDPGFSLLRTGGTWGQPSPSHSLKQLAFFFRKRRGVTRLSCRRLFTLSFFSRSHEIFAGHDFEGIFLPLFSACSEALISLPSTKTGRNAETPWGLFLLFFDSGPLFPHLDNENPNLIVTTLSLFPRRARSADAPSNFFFFLVPSVSPLYRRNTESVRPLSPSFFSSS